VRNQFILTPFNLDAPLPELQQLAQEDWYINKIVLPDMSTQQRMSAIHQPIASFVAHTCSQGMRPVSIAGDCCTALGVAAGLQRAGINPTLLWLDAHGDFNTWETTPSGFIGGMPLAMLVGRGEQGMVEAVSLRSCPENQVLLCDGRDLDPREKQALAQSGVHHIEDIRALLEHPLLADSLYIHLDVDIVNPDDAPAMRFRASGGPSSADLRSVFQTLALTKQIVAVSMATWDPRLDGDGRSKTICMELLDCLTS
jgi:arginase